MLFGVEKATKGELQNEQKTFVAHIQTDYQTFGCEANNFSYAPEVLYQEFSQFEPFIFKRKLKSRLIRPENIIQSDTYSPFSNRPPPVFC
jgi:hypothetical protein